MNCPNCQSNVIYMLNTKEFQKTGKEENIPANFCEQCGFDLMPFKNEIDKFLKKRSIV